jgi:hypothetical protein
MNQLKRIVSFCTWLIKEERGNALLFATAASVAATFGIYFFVVIRGMSIKTKERITHLYNASVIATAIDQYIASYLRVLPFPKNALLDNGEPQFTPTELKNTVGFENYQVLSLEDLEQDGYLVSASDPTALRLLTTDHYYDKKATKVKLIYSVNSENKIKDIHYLVNIAGNVYTNNAPYDATEPFFYLVSFTDDTGTGTYGSYDLTDNTVTLLKSNGSPHNSVLKIESEAPSYHDVIVLPDD